MDSGNIRSVPMRDFKPPNVNFGTVGLVAALLLLAPPALARPEWVVEIEATAVIPD